MNLVMAHQYLSQLEPDVRDAVLGNAGTIISFRIGSDDARVMARDFEPVFEPEHLVNLANYNILLKLMIDGAPSLAFSGETVAR